MEKDRERQCGVEGWAGLGLDREVRTGKGVHVMGWDGRVWYGMVWVGLGWDRMGWADMR